MKEEALTENAIIHISAKFEGPFVLQAFSVRKLTPPAAGLQMCLTDGRIYVGAKYNSTDYPEVEDYWLLEITAKYVSQHHPIIIQTMQVVSTYPRKLLGSPPCTLTDYFIKETNKTGEEEQGRPVKKMKYDSGHDYPTLLKNSDLKKPAQKEKLSAQFVSISPSAYRKKQEPKPKSDSEKKTNDKKLKLADSDEENDSVKSVKVEQKLMEKLRIQKQKQKKQSRPANGSHEKQSTEPRLQFISDLSQRKIGWSILCRVNYLNRVDTNNGLVANNFMLSDQKGDEIKCVYFLNPMDGEDDILEAGKYYVFSDGEITRPPVKGGGPRQLQISFDKNSTIIPRSNVEFEYNLSKFSRIGSIPMKEQNAEINVIGMIKSIKFLDQTTKGKHKFSSTICDPLSLHEIDLLLFLNDPEKPPEKGSIGYLHNFQLFKQHNVCRLNSTYKSYFREEILFKDELTSQFRKVKKQKNWESLPYKNLSSVAFSFRTIKDLKRIVQSQDDEKIYSLIDCWVLDATKKKFYHACRTCKKGTDKKDSGVYYCPNCKKNVQTFHCHTLTVNFADCTSHIQIDVIGEHAESLIELRSVQFNQMSNQKQLLHLQNLKGKNVTLKLKTEKKENNKKESHSVWAIEYSSPMATMREIRRRMEQSNLKNQEW